MFKDFSTAISQYAVFSGRTRRRVFWHFMLASVIITAIVEAVYGESGVLAHMLELLLIVPTLAVAVRRLHDQGRSGWWLLLAATGIGLLPLFFMMMIEGEPFDNAYGPDPKADEYSNTFEDWDSPPRKLAFRQKVEEDLYV